MEKIDAHLNRAVFYSFMKGFGDENECSICIGSVLEDPSDELVQCHPHITNEPRHIFHKACLFGYIKVAPDSQKNRCPYCRQPAFRQDQMHVLDPDIKSIILSAAGITEQLHLSADELNTMLFNTPEISNKEFVNGSWHNTTIAGHNTFRDCKFNCEMDNSVISHVDFCTCNFMVHLRQAGASMSTSLQHVQFKSVSFERVTCMHVTMHGCQFEKCDLDDCNFKGVQGQNMTFKKCKGYDDEFEDSISLNCSFEEADMRNGTFTECKFINGNFRKTNVSKSTFTDCTFIDIVFHEANFQGCTFSNCKFLDCTLLKADLTESVFSKCIFKRSFFSQAKMDDCTFQDCYISDCQFDNALLQRIKFTCVNENAKCKLNDCQFRSANLREADFTGSVIQSCFFWYALLQGVIFDECDVTQCKFGTTDFLDVSFVKASIYNQTFTNDQLERANFSLAIIDGKMQPRRRSRNKPRLID